MPLGNSEIREIPKAGTTGQVLTKDTDADYAYSWQDAGAGSGDITKDELAGGTVVTTIVDTEHIPISVAGSPNSIKKILWSVFKALFVPSTRTVNSKALSSDVTLTQDDVGDGSTYKQYSSSDKSKLAGIEASADVTDAGNVGSSISGTAAITLAIDDKIAVTDTSDSNALKHITGTGLVNFVQNNVAFNQTYYYDDTASDISTYYVLARNPVAHAEVDDTVAVKSSDGEKLIEAYATASGDPNVTIIKAGVWEFNLYRYVDSAVSNTEIIHRVYKRASGGTETELFNVSTGEINDTTVTLQTILSTQPDIILLSSDRIVIKLYAKTTHATNINVHFTHNGTTNYSHVHTPVIYESSSTGGLDIHGLSAETTIENADEMPFYDDSTSTNKKITFANFWLKVKGLISGFVFPIGRVVMFDNSTSDPNTLYGNTWSRIDGPAFPGIYKAGDANMGTPMGTFGANTKNLQHTHSTPSLSHSGTAVDSHTVNTSALPFNETPPMNAALTAIAVSDHTVTQPSAHSAGTSGNGLTTTQDVLNAGITLCFWRRTA